MLQDGHGRGRLLAVDDSADSADLVARVAAKCGFDAQAISDPKSVKTVVAAWKPEVLTLDLCMPDADGIDLLSVLEETRFSGVLVIISGQDDWFRKAASRLAELRGIKVVDDLQKPVDIAVLQRLLSRLRPAS